MTSDCPSAANIAKFERPAFPFDRGDRNVEDVARFLERQPAEEPIDAFVT
jgi:hypothetical protein